MKQTDLNWKSKDGVKFFAHTWEPEDTPKAIVTLVHGFGEHCVRYTPYFEYLTSDGVAILGFDLRGHGETGGKRGVIESYSILMDDIEDALSKSKELYPDIPQYLYGHSMGGNLVLNYLIRNKPNINGAIVTSPWLTLTHEPNSILKGLVSMLKNIVPNMTIDSGLKTEHISTVISEVDKYKDDPLNHSRISFRLFSEITDTGLWALDNAININVPVLLMHGTADEITSPLSSKKLSESNDVIEYVEWEKSYHEIHNEANREDVASVVSNWVNARYKSISQS